MRYFINSDNLKFFKEPEAFNKHTPMDMLKYAIGANMYMPGTQTNIFHKLIGNKFHDIGAITLCCEDAIKESDLEAAEANILQILENLYYKAKENPDLMNQLPLIFIRVRSTNQFENLLNRMNEKHLSILAGFNFPKFNSSNGDRYFTILERASKKYNEVLYGMPILEDNSIIYRETRTRELKKIQEILTKYPDYVLNIRVGGTDFSSIFGLRRRVNTTIYDLRVVSDCLIDILNYFARNEKGYVVSGPVWEYFSWNKESEEIMGLKKELMLDIENGFHGKTIIHPSQIDTVNRSYAVEYEQYIDASNILAAEGGVFKSIGGNCMNETGPHRVWASRIIARAKIFGVLDKHAQVEE